MILDEIVEAKRQRLIEHKNKITPGEMRRRAEETRGTPHSLKEALKKPGISIIGEFKQASPSLGEIKSKINLSERIEAYNDSVDAISCLTEEDHFCGSVDDLKEIRARSPLPILRKDFMIDEYQFYEAKAIGADAVLLIAAILDDAMLHDFYQLSAGLGLDALVEVHDEREMERALREDVEIVGVNNRNLRDFSIDLSITRRLSVMVPENKVFVAESGIVTEEDVRFLKQCRVDAFLIGRALMETKHPAQTVLRWKRVEA